MPRGLFLVAIVCLFSCSAPKALEYRGCKNLVIEKPTFDSATARLEVMYYNPNNFGMKLKRADLDLYADSNFVGHISQEYQLKIHKKSEFSVPLQINVDVQHLLRNTLSALFTHEIHVRATGTITLKKSFIRYKVPVNYQSIQRLNIN
jgi:LEA14-like dessication related protein